MNAGPFSKWASTITKIAKAICESLLSKKAPVAAREDLTTSNTCHTIIAKSFWEKKCSCGSRDDFFNPNTCHRIPGTPFLPKKKRLRQPGKTSTGLIHVIELQERRFCRKKAPAAAGKTSPGLDSQMALAIFVIGQILSQFEL